MSDDGVTLVEMTISVLLTAILLTIVLVVLNTFTKVESNTQSTYAELNQLIPVGTSFQHLLRSAVSWAPPSNAGVPTPPFGVYTTMDLASTSITSTHLIFFTNTGRTTKATGHLLGPTKVTAALTCPATIPTPAKRDCTFKVTTYTAEKTTCPGLTAPTTVPCKWSTSGRTLFTIEDVNNWTTKNSTVKPVFSYYLARTPTTTKKKLPSPTAPVSFPLAPSANPFKSCTGPTPINPHVTKCIADHIQSVKVDVEVATPGALARGGKVTKVEDQTVTYQLSAISQTYTAAVG